MTLYVRTPIGRMAMEDVGRARDYLRREAERWPEAMAPVPPDEWPAIDGGDTGSTLLAVWRSREFLAQLYRDANGTRRLTVIRAMLEPGGRTWVGGITWDELQRVKRECGFGDVWAVEVFPPDDRVVNVGNLRHLWLLDAAPEYAWKAP